MVLDRKAVSGMLLNSARLLKEYSDRLSEIDSRFGDGDHGITMKKIAGLIEEQVPVWGERSIQAFLKDLGTAVMEVKGGSAGPLYGTLVGGLGALLAEDENELEADGVKRMFAGALSEMEDITTAKVGAVQAAEGGVKELLVAASEAAQAGAKASEDFPSKFGRARSYKEQTIGTPDAGAVSTALFIRGMAEGI